MDFLHFSGILIFADMPKFVGQIQNVTVYEGAKQVLFKCTVNKIGSHSVFNFVYIEIS